MILYHFTAAHFIKSIQARGLNKGSLPWNFNEQGKPEMLRGYQWLTANPNFNQPWCLLGNLPYARNAVRITVEIPMTHQHLLARWLDLCAKHRPHCADEINATGGDVENWRVYRGAIPKAWFLSVDMNFQERLSPEALNLG